MVTPIRPVDDRSDFFLEERPNYHGSTKAKAHFNHDSFHKHEKHVDLDSFHTGSPWRALYTLRYGEVIEFINGFEAGSHIVNRGTGTVLNNELEEAFRTKSADQSWYYFAQHLWGRLEWENLDPANRKDVVYETWLRSFFPSPEQIEVTKQQYIPYLIERIEDYYLWREICTENIKEFIFYLKKHIMNNISWLLYMLGRSIPDGLPINPFVNGGQQGTTVHKLGESQSHTENPESQFQGNEDYLNNSNAHQLIETQDYNTQNLNDQLSKYIEFMDYYIDPINQFLKRLEVCFLQILSTEVF